MANRFFEGAAHAAAYAKFRPHPPLSLVERIVSFAKESIFMNKNGITKRLTVYNKDTGGYWGTGRLDVDTSYSDGRFKIPYPDFIRDESHYVDKIATVAELTGYLTSWSGFQNFRAKNGDEAAQKILENFQDKFMKILKVSTTPEETSIPLRFHYFLLMGRKPSE